MTRISLELVPRTRSGLRAELAMIAAELPNIDTINIPDLLRFSTRSWEGAAFARPHFSAIPHVRAIDLNPKEPLPMAEVFIAHDIKEVLIITGDAPNDMGRQVYKVDAEDAIRRFKHELPHIKIYAGLDPYRQSFNAERDYLDRKLDAGAVGFFSQPFFDLRMMEIYADLIPDNAEMWWGITNVTSEGSLNYWQTRNNAIFPKSFELSLECNRRLAIDALQFARDRGHHICYQPIRTDLKAYLEGII